MSKQRDDSVLQLSFWNKEAYDELPPQRKLFVEYYCQTFSARKAAEMAGYSVHSAKAIGCEILSFPTVKQAIDDRMKIISENSKVTHDYITSELLAMTEVSINDFYNSKGVLKPVNQWTDEMGKSVRKITHDKNGRMSIELFNRKEPLEMLARHKGYFLEDNTQKAVSGVHVYLPDNGRDNIDSEQE